MNTKDSIRRAYDQAADDYAAKWWNEFENKHFDRVMLGWYASQIPVGERVLEIGSGPGEVSGYLANLGVNVTGTDLSPQMIANARKYFPHIPFEVQSFFDLQFPEASFSGVIAFYAIVNLGLEDVKRVFEQVQRVLKAGGLFLFTFHIFEAEDKTDVPDFFGKEDNPLTFYYFKVDEMKAVVEELGFKVVDILRRYPYPGVEYGSKRAYFILRTG